MSNLQKFLAALVERAPINLGVAEMQHWIENGTELTEALAKVLRRNVVAVEQAATQTLTVLSDLTLADRIAAGKYDWVNEHVTGSNFPHDSTSVGEWEWKLFHFGRNISSKKAVAAMVADGWDTAKLEHLLAFGHEHPDEQRKYPIVALGSSCTVDGGRVVPGLWDGGTVLDLGLSFWGVAWRDRYRFLAVRRKV